MGKGSKSWNRLRDQESIGRRPGPSHISKTFDWVHELTIPAAPAASATQRLHIHTPPERAEAPKTSYGFGRGNA